MGDASLLPRLEMATFILPSPAPPMAPPSPSLQSMNAFPPSAGRFGSAIDSPIGIDTSHVLCVGFSQARFGSRRPRTDVRDLQSPRQFHRIHRKKTIDATLGAYAS